MSKGKSNPIAWAWRVFCRRLIEAAKAKLAKLKAKLRGAPKRGSGGPARRRRPTNPRCDSCELFVSRLCRRGCGVCERCCPGCPTCCRNPSHDHQNGQSADGGKFTTSAESS